ncbi:acyltransferase [Pseudoclavibacter alba]|uniref:Acyltransferase n=1 Tax=Pseudoclavibacter albus TaxID=272241 RepID=A0ABT2HTW9_9MICO|nr:acyltransferase family protein [Pseudoclavibacter alba]MCT2041773.1 acyltransferase [Pseudoclavibacter alba]
MAGQETTTSTGSPTSGSARVPSYIPEVQGLRTVALLLVASFHVWFDRVSGGVDIFLLISAYLLTRSHTARALNGKLTSPVRTVVKKFARLLPAAAAVIMLTLVGVYFVDGPRYALDSLWSATASATYWMNFLLQANQVDYFAAQVGSVDPYQQFWSLSIQGQVFILWPLLHLGSELVARLLKRDVRWVLTPVFGVLTLTSFAYAVQLTAVNQMHAYFDTAARLWEFGAGSLLALVVPFLRLPRTVRKVMSWVGILGVISCGLVLPVGSTFPGWAALWPVISAGLIISAADSRRAEGEPAMVNAFLAHPALRIAGGYTYALYLTHWPVLVLTESYTGRSAATPVLGTIVLLISAVLAVVVTLLVERPAAAFVSKLSAPAVPAEQQDAFHHARSSNRASRIRAVVVPAVVAAVSVALVATTVIGVRHMSRVEVAAIEARINSTEPPLVNPDEPWTFGAMNPSFNAGERVYPAHGDVKASWVSGPHCTDLGLTPTSNLCWHRESPNLTDDPNDILIVGNSHIAQASAMFDVIAQTGEHNLRVRTFVGPGCDTSMQHWSQPFSDDMPEDTRPQRCERAWSAAGEYARTVRPELIVILGTRQGMPDEGEQFFESFPEWIASNRAELGSDFLVLRDVPRFANDPFLCAADNGYGSRRCVNPAPPAADPVQVAAIEQAGGIWIDLTDAICPGGECRPSMGGVVTYMDDNHLTEPFSQSLSQRLCDAVSPRVSWFPKEAWPDVQ